MCLAAFIVAYAFSLPVQTQAIAEETSELTVELTPFGAVDGPIYHCFYNPTSVFADNAGIIVSGDNGIEFIDNNFDISGKRDIPCRKTYRLTSNGKTLLITLSGDGDIIASDNEQSAALSVDGLTEKYNDFSVSGNTLFALTERNLVRVQIGDDGLNAAAAQIIALDSDAYPAIKASAVAVRGEKTYVAVNSVFGSKQDICSVAENGALTQVFIQSDMVVSMSAPPSRDGELYVLSRGKAVRYKESAGGLLPINVIDGVQLTALYAYGEYVYALDTLNALHRFSQDLSQSDVLVASGSDAKGFFNMPRGVYCKNSTMFAADSLNSRIAVYGDDITYSERLNNPVSVAADSSGTVYVAYDYTKISSFANGNIAKSSETAIISGTVGVIKQISVNAQKSLYVLSDSGIWRVKRGENPTLLDGGKYKAFTLSIGRENLYALSDGAVVKFTDNSPVELCAAPSDAVSLAVDLDGNAFVLSPNRITKISADGSLSTVYYLSTKETSYTLGGKSGHLSLCTVENEFVNHGDIIVTDTYKHRIFKTTGAALGARFIDENYQTPIVGDSTTPCLPQNRIIRTVLRDTPVYSVPMETQSIYTIEAGRYVIVPIYDLEEAHEYSLVLVDDPTGNKLVQGYVYQDCLAPTPLEYEAPPNAVCTVFSDVTAVYKWPSRFAKALDDYSTVDKNTEFPMLDFVKSYRDEFGYYWYRISVSEGCEGYIPAVNISTTRYNKANILPDYNGEIIAYNGNVNAAIYELNNGKYTIIDGKTLSAGTKIEIVGAYDSSQPYTKIKFLDAESQTTVTCYVKTEHVKYRGINIVLIIAIVVIIITVILAAIIIARTYRAKKKRLDRSAHKFDDNAKTD